jgi:hypothetical protein
MAKLPETVNELIIEIARLRVLFERYEDKRRHCLRHAERVRLKGLAQKHRDRFYKCQRALAAHTGEAFNWE